MPVKTCVTVDMSLSFYDLQQSFEQCLLLLDRSRLSVPSFSLKYVFGGDGIQFYHTVPKHKNRLDYIVIHKKKSI